jgi:ABC-type dipeptide/oligopeptide/nickel transport system permease component
MLQGDWGFSFVSRIDVDTLILQRLPVTMAVIGLSQVLALLVALPVGVLAAVKPYSWFDRIASTLAFVGFSLPTFFTGMLFILLFSIHLGWLPFVYRADISETGWPGGGSSSSSHHADHGAGPVPGRQLDALRALGGAGRDPAGLRDHRAQQGPGRSGWSSTSTWCAMR